MQTGQKSLRMPSLENELLHHPKPRLEVAASLLSHLRPLSHPVLTCDDSVQVTGMISLLVSTHALNSYTPKTENSHWPTETCIEIKSVHTHPLATDGFA